MSNFSDDHTIDYLQVQENPLHAIFDELGINLTRLYGDWPFVEELIVSHFQDRIKILKELRKKYRAMSDKARAQLLEQGISGGQSNSEYIEFMRSYESAISFLHILYNLGCYFATVASAKHNETQIQSLLRVEKEGFTPGTPILSIENIKKIGIDNVVWIRFFVFTHFGISLE